MKILMKIFCCCLLFFCFSSCRQEMNRNVSMFKDTKAFELAKAVEASDLKVIEKLVKEDKGLLEVTNPISGSNVLILALYTESYEAFKKLLELGADPNFVNPYTKKSALIESIKFYENPEPYTIDKRYAKLLLKNGADSNYTIEKDFADEKGNFQNATTPLMQASKFDVGFVKLLINYGANPNKKLEEDQSTAFTAAFTGFKNRFDVINYFIDDLKIDVHQPMKTWSENENLYIQDYIKKYMSYKEGSQGYNEREKLVTKLKRMGVEFKDYNYKL